MLHSCGRVGGVWEYAGRDRNAFDPIQIGARGSGLEHGTICTTEPAVASSCISAAFA